MRTLELRKNNAYRTVLLVEDGIVVGSWEVTDQVMDDFYNHGNLDDWSETWPDINDPDGYGDLEARLNG